MIFFFLENVFVCSVNLRAETGQSWVSQHCPLQIRSYEDSHLREKPDMRPSVQAIESRGEACQTRITSRDSPALRNYRDGFTSIISHWVVSMRSFFRLSTLSQKMVIPWSWHVSAYGDVGFVDIAFIFCLFVWV